MVAQLSLDGSRCPWHQQYRQGSGGPGQRGNERRTPWHGRCRWRSDWPAGRAAAILGLLVLAFSCACQDIPGDDDSTSVPPSSPVAEPTSTPWEEFLDQDGDGYSVEDGDCDDTDPRVYPGGVEIAYDGVDQDCDQADLTDVDGDGYDSLQVGGPDCDDSNPDTHPGAEETGDGRDNDCNGLVDDGVDTVDNDGDGYSEMDGDCDDADHHISPAAEEVPYDGVDQDCDGSDLTDADGDGHDGGTDGTDCDDNDPSISPSATEVPYDGIDQDCSGSDLDDLDEDGSPGGPAGDDCDDNDPARSPALDEIPYDGIDNDCDGHDLEDVDADGHVGMEAGGDDCNDDDPAIHPQAAEVPYDGVDQDCDGADLNDADGDGYVATQAAGDDCDDNDVNTHPGATEFADGRDNDCDGSIDENLSTTDDDGDGYAESDGDCNDYDAATHPGAEDVPYDGVDQDCDGADLTDVDGDGYPGGLEGTDCNDEDALTWPGAQEIPYDGVDQDCDGADLDDVDGDGTPGGPGGPDCDDGDPFAYPEASEVPYDGIDQDCDGADLDDVDGDGFAASSTEQGTDCNDADDTIHPDADETCDGIDNNCDDIVDTDAVDRQTFYVDGDHDGFGDPGAPVEACAETDTWIPDDRDCDDTDAYINPEAQETCDGVDNDCDSAVDEDLLTPFYRDADGDGYGDPDTVLEACSAPGGYTTSPTDCDDNAAAVFPGADEVCNEIDDNCDGAVDEDQQNTYYRDADQDGYGDSSQFVLACSPPPGYVSDDTDCRDTNDAIHPGALEYCDGVDDDCDGAIDEGVLETFYLDDDGDGYGGNFTSLDACVAPEGYVLSNTDCDDNDPNVHPGATELCDEALTDENCNGLYNDQDPTTAQASMTSFYPDADGDGHGDEGDEGTLYCSAPTGGGVVWVTSNDDCDDTRATAHPGADELPNGLDDNCNGEIDEGISFSSCLEIKQADPSAASGNYAIDPDGPGGTISPFQVFCDMETDGGGYTMVRFDDSSLAGDQNTYAAFCAGYGLEVIVPRTKLHAMSMQGWNGNEPPNLVNVFPRYNGAYGLSNWTGRCRGQECTFWMSDSDSCGCTNFEPNGDNDTSYRIYRRTSGCEFGNWNDAYNRVDIQGWVICSTNDK